MSHNYLEQFPTKFRGYQKMRSERWRDRQITARKSWTSTHETNSHEKFPLHGHPQHHTKIRWRALAYGTIAVAVIAIGAFALTIG